MGLTAVAVFCDEWGTAAGPEHQLAMLPIHQLPSPVSGNTAGISQVNIFVHGNNSEIERNDTFATAVFDGIRLPGDQSRVHQNHVLSGAESGIFLSGNNNVIVNNAITEAKIGVLKAIDSSGNIIAGNHFFNTPVAVQDPQSVDVAKLISPKR